MNLRNLLLFLFEVGHLKQIKHEGWRYAGIEHPESVADHSLRAAQIGYFLAKLEKYENPFEVCTMVVFHDIAECRTGDIHKIGSRYVKVNEEHAAREQIKRLEGLGAEIFSLWKQVEYRSTKAGIIGKDADLLEQAITGREYIEKGHPRAQDWIDNVEKHVKTKSAKKLLQKMKSVHPDEWWEGLKKLDKEQSK